MRASPLPSVCLRIQDAVTWIAEIADAKLPSCGLQYLQSAVPGDRGASAEPAHMVANRPARLCCLKLRHAGEERRKIEAGSFKDALFPRLANYKFMNL